MRRSWLKDPPHRTASILTHVDWSLTDWIRNNSAPSMDGSGVYIGIVDTGVQPHPDLPPMDLFDVTGLGPEDENGHGTHVVGIMAGLDNGVGVIGAAPGAIYTSVRCLDSCGLGDDEDVARAVDICVEEDCDIINMSLGMRGHSDVIESSVLTAISNGVIIVAASGNDRIGRPTQFPACIPQVISVGSIGPRGPSSYTCEGDVMVPGEDIPSTWLDGGYAVQSGTSQACPLASALIAIRLQAFRIVPLEVH